MLTICVSTLVVPIYNGTILIVQNYAIMRTITFGSSAYRLNRWSILDANFV